MRVTIYRVGGFNPIHRVRNIQEALESAKHGDTIELYKHVSESVTIDKNIFINGNGHVFHVRNGQVGITANRPLHIDNLVFNIEPYANAVVLNQGGKFHQVTAKIKGPVFDIYPSIYLINGSLELINCDLMKLITEESTTLRMTDTLIKSYYPETIRTHSSAERSLIKGECIVENSTIQHTSCWRLIAKNSQLGPYTDVMSGHLTHCGIKQPSFDQKTKHNEPKAGPLQQVYEWYYAIGIFGDVTIDQLQITQRLPKKWIGIYADRANIQLVHTHLPKGMVKHHLQDSSLMVKHSTDANLWQLERSTLSVVDSKINSTLQELSAMEKLHQLIGLENVKQHITSLLNTIKVSKKQSGNKDYGMSHHLIFAGSPGTAKTTVARLVAQALFEAGVLPENKLTEATVDTLIKGYVGQTADNVRQILDKALGGVLFIDEAYQLSVKQGQNTFNDEALAVIIRYMEDHRDNLVVIAAGYPKEMKEFVASNAGLARRFNWIDFPDYDTDELIAIFEHVKRSYGDHYAEDWDIVQPFLYQQFDALTRYYLDHKDATGRSTNGGNGGLARNVYQSVLLHRNNRVVRDHLDDLTITMHDLKKGFDDEFEKARNMLS